MAKDSLAICVAALTYRRPVCLRRLLDAFGHLEAPENCLVHFLIVDNDPECRARPIVRAARRRIPWLDIRYTPESEPGIPAARNRALNKALFANSDVLCFTDDDAWPDRLWLVHLIECYRKSNSVLVFGPQRLVIPENLGSWWKRFIARSLQSRSRFIEQFSAKQASRARIATSGTYNCLLNLSWIARKGIRFDTTLRFSGGEDTAFREAVRQMGGRMVWCPGAIIFEELADERLSLKYQFHRSRTQGINAAKFERPIYPEIFRHPIGRIIAGFSLIIVPILGWGSFMLGLHQIGMGIGVIQSRRGKRAHLYSR